MTLSAAAELDAFMAALRAELTRALQSGHEGEVVAKVKVKITSKGPRIGSAMIAPAWIDTLAGLERKS